MYDGKVGLRGRNPDLTPNIDDREPGDFDLVGGLSASRPARRLKNRDRQIRSQQGLVLRLDGELVERPSMVEGRVGDGDSSHWQGRRSCLLQERLRAQDVRRGDGDGWI